jgi:hypothetical protein
METTVTLNDLLAYTVDIYQHTHQSQVKVQ